MTPDWLLYDNQGATRSQPLAPELTSAMGFLPDLGLQMKVFSGGQPGVGTSAARVGSTRHDHGKAADVFFYKDGQQLDWANPAHVPTFQEVVRRAKAAGLTGFGAGPGYMQPGSMHIGFGTPAVWGAGGKSANAPEWLRTAYGAAPSGTPLTFGPGVPPAPTTPQGIAGMFGDPAAGLSMGAPIDPFAAGIATQTQAQAQERQRRDQDERDAAETRRVALLSRVGQMFV
jgi:hypothetical protein